MGAKIQLEFRLLKQNVIVTLPVVILAIFVFIVIISVGAISILVEALTGLAAA